MSDLPFGFDRPEDSPGFLLWQTTMVWQRQIRSALEPYDISHAQFVIMATLMWLESNRSSITQISIVNLTKLDKMTVSKSLKKLVMLGYASRSEHETDTRAKSTSLTEQGKEMVRILVPIVEGIDARFFGKASCEEQKSLVNILAKLTASTTDE
ncbi:MAG: MarR family transcriptional regulator [Pseudomonadota bacterium]